uniref:Uncharacterized protein n=1 Tax=Arundo donax TaxID=35708 RepID=A0A0A9BKR6_ARUDO
MKATPLIMFGNADYTDVQLLIPASTGSLSNTTLEDFKYIGHLFVIIY